MQQWGHEPVMLDRVVALLEPALNHDGAVLVDCTLGLGGHSAAVLERLSLARVIGIDRDPEALRRAGSGWPVSETGSPAYTRCMTRSAP